MFNATNKTDIELIYSQIFSKPELYTCNLNIFNSENIVFKMYNDIMNKID